MSKFHKEQHIWVRAVVKDIDDNSDYPVCVGCVDGEEYIWVHKDNVRAYVQKSATSWNNIEVSRGDVVAVKDHQLVFKVFDLTDTAALLEGHPTPVESQDIIHVYKKSWEKPKELEEMSKEELIKLVKQLKGEE